MKKDTITKILPIYSIENEFIISKNGDISLAYKVTLPKVYSLNIAEVNKINDLFDKIIRYLPEDTIIQKQDYFFVDAIKNHNKKDKNTLSGGDNGLFYEKPLLHHECYLFITKDSKNRISFTSTQKGYDLYSEEIKVFLENVFTCMSFLNDSGFFSVKKLNDESIIKIIGKYFSLSKEGGTSVRDLFFDKKLQVGENFGEIYTIGSPDQLPYMFDSGKINQNVSEEYLDYQIPFIQPICLDLECNHIYNQVIYIDKSKSILAKLNQFKSSPIQSKDNEFTYSTQINELVDIVLEKQLKLINMHFSIILWDVEGDKVQKSKKQLENSFKKLGIIPYQVKYGIKELYINNAPGAAVYIPEDYKFIGLSEQVPVFLNFESYYKGNKEGILFNDRKIEVPIRLDLWDEPIKRGLIENRNRLVFGAIERGETFLINHISSQYNEQGHMVILLDINDSYKNICDEIGGSYYIYDLDTTIKFNPFYVANPEEVTDEKKEFLIQLIHLLWKSEVSYIKDDDKQAISACIEKFYRYISLNETVFPCMFSFYEFIDQNLNKKDVATKFDKVTLLASLKIFYDGKYKMVFNSEDSLDLIKNRFVVFELSNIKNDPVLFPLISMLCVDVIMDKIKQIPEVKKSIFINECWKPISSKGMTCFIKTLYKTVNNFYGELVLIAQDIEHILETASSGAIISQTDTIIMLNPKSKKTIKDKLATHLSFTESDLEKLYSIDKREVFIKVGNISNVYIIEEMLCRLPRFKTPINLKNNYF